jgi:hypothetical protein
VFGIRLGLGLVLGRKDKVTMFEYGQCLKVSFGFRVRVRIRIRVKEKRQSEHF